MPDESSKPDGAATITADLIFRFHDDLNVGPEWSHSRCKMLPIPPSHLSQPSPIKNLMELVQPLDLRIRLERGAYFRPWVDRARKGDALAFIELALECDNLDNRDFGYIGLGPMASGAISFLQNSALLSDDKGRRDYYLALLTRIAEPYGAEREERYVKLLELSSAENFPPASWRYSKEIDRGGGLAYSIIISRYKLLNPESQLSSLKTNTRNRALDQLSANPQLFDEETAIELSNEEVNHATSQRHAVSLGPSGSLGRNQLRELARHGSLRCQMYLNQLDRVQTGKLDPDFTPGSHEVKEMIDLGHRGYPPAIEWLVGYFKNRGDLKAVEYWAKIGEEALGGPTEWTDLTDDGSEGP